MACSWEGGPRGNARPPPVRRGAVLRGHAPVHASSYDSARERCGGWPPRCTTPTYELAPLLIRNAHPRRFSYHMYMYEVHHSHVGVVREWCGSGAVGAPPPRRAVEPSTEPQARASGIVRDDGRLAMSISAHAARSTSAVGCRQSDCSRQRFAGCRVGEYMSSGVWRVPSFDRGNKAFERISDPLFPWSRA